MIASQETTMPAIANPDLSRAGFQANGYAGPATVFSPAENARFAAGAWAALAVDPAAPGPSTARLAAWHHEHAWAWEMATHPAILDQVEELLGPDLVLWAMFCWYKPPHVGKAVPWHQDAAYWPIEPKLNVTAWVALAPTRRSNGCLRLLPGSHRSAHDHTAMTDPASWFAKGVQGLDESTALDVEMERGQAVFFNEGALHGSRANASDQPRLACSMRYTTPEVRISPDGWGPDSARIRTTLVRGVDRFHHNDALRIGPPA
jgi:hypothetical protein